MNHISENLMSISFENHKNWSKYNQCDLELKMEFLKLLAIQSKIFEVNLLMKGRIWEKRLADIIFALTLSIYKHFK